MRTHRSRYRSAGLWIVVASAVVTGAPAATLYSLQRTPADVAVRAARWLDPASGRYTGPAVTLVTGERISGVVPASQFDPASARQLIDLGDLTALPGLVDAHVHLEIGGDPAANAIAILRAGFTTVVDLGATSDVVLRLRDAITAGSTQGPRILAAGRWIGTKNGICEFGGIGVAGGPDAFRGRVRENVDAGADLIKVCVSGWQAQAFARPDQYEIADEALLATVDEAQRHKRLVVAHAIGIGSVRASARAGVNGLAHAAFLDAATATALREHDVFLIPTLATLLAGSQDAARAALQSSVTAAHAARVRLVFGTDSGVLPHGENAKEFAAMVEAGIPPGEAIRAATVNAARALGLAGTIGAIEVDRSADIIGVEGDPLREVGVLSRVSFVMHNGRVVRRAGDPGR